VHTDKQGAEEGSRGKYFMSSDEETGTNKKETRTKKEKKKR
jgi:hypothetical protein